MPELPEVETIKNDLRPHVERHRFTDVAILWPNMVQRPSVEELYQRLPGQLINEVARRGKYLIFRLASGEALILHMRMSGLLLLRAKGDTPAEFAQYVRAVFSLDNGKDILFCDRRKLGTVSLVENESELDDKLGPEPFDSSFTPEALRERLSNRKAPIKAVLCDQKIVSGIGNMYADEALFLAHINPMRIANTLSVDEVTKLHETICHVLKKGIANTGATFSDYRRPHGEGGKQQDEFYVAHRRGQTCKVCNTPIERVSIRNRGAYFCPRCQCS